MCNYYKSLQNTFISLSFKDTDFVERADTYDENNWIKIVNETREHFITYKNIDSICKCSDYLLQFYYNVNVIHLIESEIPEALCNWIIYFTNTYITSSKNDDLTNYLNNNNYPLTYKNKFVAFDGKWC